MNPKLSSNHFRLLSNSTHNKLSALRFNNRYHRPYLTNLKSLSRCWGLKTCLTRPC